MPRQVVPLTDTKLRNLKATHKPIPVFDGAGLFILVNPTGGKWWRFKYTFAGKTKTLSFGTYPEVSLKDARERRDEARKLLANDIDPGAQRKAKKREAEHAEATFEAVFHEWLVIQSASLAETTANKIKSSMTIHALAKIGGLPIRQIKTATLLSMLRAIEEKDALEMARRVRAWTSRVFRYGIITGKCERDPAVDLRGALRAPVVVHHASLPTAQLPAFLNALDNPMVRLYPLTRLALKLLVLTATRPIELRAAEWSEIHLKTAEWRVPGQRMKMKQEHVVPLSNQAIATITQLKAFSGDHKYLFPVQGPSETTLSENTLGKAAKSLGFAVTAHGFRSTFSTYANESEKWSSDAIEAQLAHKPPDEVRNAYYRGNRRMEERRRLMQWWADELDRLRAASE